MLNNIHRPHGKRLVDQQNTPFWFALGEAFSFFKSSGFMETIIILLYLPKPESWCAEKSQVCKLAHLLTSLHSNTS